ncbi:hypothetical protein [Phenylobacterium sp.]|uniref:hypothetical protein n=1 Tax=Phenylobacterium sp. TaxID=1871053 RepID=UPI0039838AC1
MAGREIASWLAGGLLAGAALPGWAQTPPSPPPACATAEHRQLDFWIGAWTVAPTP